jgi:hypothetical protein
MTIPTDLPDNLDTIGSSDMKHPIITFQVVMKRQLQETFGPITNSRNVTVLHPDMYDSSPDRGRSHANQHETLFQPLLPGYLRDQNIVRNDDGTFTAYGQLAVYLKKNYADIDNPYLVITNSAPYTSP